MKLKQCFNAFTNLAKRTPVGKRIATGWKNGKIDLQFRFKGLDSSATKVMESYKQSVKSRGLNVAMSIPSDSEFMSVLKRYAQKNNFADVNLENKNTEELLEIILQKSGVGPCKFAQIVSSDEQIMSKLSPKMQEIIKKTQSENPFSRTLQEAQVYLENALCCPPAGGGGREEKAVKIR
ncbi:MAG: hypothetical protein NC390_07610, partial [Fusobacterium sp.]|nr:hypothetical protein [Fusobacterium sp.]